MWGSNTFSGERLDPILNTIIMQAVWNNRLLKPPPTISLSTPLKERGKVTLVLNVLKEMQNVKDKQSALNIEEFALCRIIYKLNSQLRSEKTLQFLKRIKVCLTKLAGMKIEKAVDDILHILQQSNLMARNTYLPSQQMMEHLLVKLMGVRNLYRQTINYCFTAYVHLKQQLTIGTLVPQNLALMALVSRLWVLTRTCFYSCTHWYEELRPCLGLFLPIEHPWLPDDVVLPNTIAESDDDPEPLDINQSSAYHAKYFLEREGPKKKIDFLSQRDTVGEDSEDESEDGENLHHSVSHKAGQKTLPVSIVDRNNVARSKKVPSRGDEKCISKAQGTASHTSQSSEDEGEPVLRTWQTSNIVSHPPDSSEDEGEPVLRTRQTSSVVSHPPDSSEDEGEPVLRTWQTSNIVSHPPDSSEDEGEPVLRTRQTSSVVSHPPDSSEDEGEPVLRTRQTSSFVSHPPDSSEDEGEPVLRTRQTSSVVSHPPDSSEDEGELVLRTRQTSSVVSHPPDSSEDESEPVLRTRQINKAVSQSPKQSKEFAEVSVGKTQQIVKNKTELVACGPLCVRKPKITRHRDVSSHVETESRCVSHAYLHAKIIKKSSVQELIQMLNDVHLTNQDERQLVKSCIETLEKIRNECRRNVHPLTQNKKARKARKLVMRMNSELAQLRAVQCEQKKKKMRVKEQWKITTPLRVMDGKSYEDPKPRKKRKREQQNTTTQSMVTDVDPKPGKKRKRDNQVGISDEKKKCKGRKSETPAQISDGFQAASKESQCKFLKMVKQWQKCVKESSTWTSGGVKHKLNNTAKKKTFLKKLKAVKQKYLNEELTEEECIKAIDSYLISV
ncbi:uncharacterized protein LOC125650080 [Ostrea edulis]|uniref:uncharacterized protein LOC125650080 n=1 Tax=Ostrea edulis TaxID=37623 RepID=UPI0024AFC8DA|nr:uncharacterized protein LOC125650080 [Ostrea edulis]